MKNLQSFVKDAWVSGNGSNAITLHNATTEAAMAVADTGGVDFSAVLAHGRQVGGPALRAMTFAQRGEMLSKLSQAVVNHRDELLTLGIENAGNTRSDAKFDVDGASATLAYYGELCRTLGDARHLVDGDPVPLGRSSRLSGGHLYTSRMGVAVHINAFNFPAWGMAEKAATCLAAGMPFITKPASATALMAWRLFEVLVQSGALPPGTAQLLCGGVGDLMDHLGSQDVVAFTGSSDTAVRLRGHPRALAKGVPVNVEADSLNVAVAGPDLEQGTATWDLFVNNVVKEITQKAGQKCTAIRRVMVPAPLMDAVIEVLVDRLGTHKVGNPALDQVTVGPLATAAQKQSVRQGLGRLCTEAKVVCGGMETKDLVGVDNGKGYFVMPTLLRAADGDALHVAHELEVFGPVATVMPYRTADHAAALAARGDGGLVASVYSDDKTFATDMLMGLAPHHGRVVLGSEKVAGAFIPPGTVMPSLLHGGPGRAGGGQELGGTRGMALYMQRTAVQAFGPWLDAACAAGHKLS